jgi:hypothetical protein
MYTSGKGANRNC